MKQRLLTPLLAGCLLPMVAATTFDHTESFAWCANTGWIAFRHDRPAPPAGVNFGGAFLAGHAWSPGIGWIHFGDGAPANGFAYANNGSDHGVNHDGGGNLSGYAWSGNTGWINFGWAAVGNPNRPRVDLLTGEFSGFAWGANTGWLNLGTGLLTTRGMLDADSDGDGLPDWWERRHFGNLSAAHATSDRDGDGVTDLHEYRAGTDPVDTDSWLRIVSYEHEADAVAAWIEFTSNRNRLYRIEYSRDLDGDHPWTDCGLGIFRADVGTTTTRRIILEDGTHRFFRAAALVPLQP